MQHTTLKRNGGWTIELETPIGSMTEINIPPVSLDHTIRWSRHEIPSVLALLSELTGIKETALRQLTGNDSDRVFIAFSFMAPATIKKDFEQGTRPLATPPEAFTEEQLYEQLADNNDPVDPRFPKVNEPVQRYKEPVKSQPTDDDSGMSFDAPDILKKVG